MRTDDLIAMLARNSGPAEPVLARRRMAWGLVMALVAMVVVESATLGLLPLGLWGESSTGPKLAYALAIAATAHWLTARLGRPGWPASGAVAVLVGVFALAVAIGIGDLLRVAPDLRLAHVMGGSALRCPVVIAALSVPALGAGLSALRALAPVRPVAAGLAAGLMAGGFAAAAYALSCTEPAFAFVAIWYTLGVLLSGVIGAVAGPFALRW